MGARSSDTWRSSGAWRSSRSCAPCVSESGQATEGLRAILSWRGGACSGGINGRSGRLASEGRTRRDFNASLRLVRGYHNRTERFGARAVLVNRHRCRTRVAAGRAARTTAGVIVTPDDMLCRPSVRTLDSFLAQINDARQKTVGLRERADHTLITTRSGSHVIRALATQRRRGPLMSVPPKGLDRAAHYRSGPALLCSLRTPRRSGVARERPQDARA